MPKARLKYYSSSEFKANNYFGSPNAYQTVLYINFEFRRPTYEVFTEVNQKSDNENVITFEAVTEKISFDLLFVPPMLTTLFAINLHDIVELELIATGEVFTLENINIEDAGGPDSKLATQTITAEMKPFSASSGCADEGYVKDVC